MRQKAVKARESAKSAKESAKAAKAGSQADRGKVETELEYVRADDVWRCVAS